MDRSLVRALLCSAATRPILLALDQALEFRSAGLATSTTIGSQPKGSMADVIVVEANGVLAMHRSDEGDTATVDACLDTVETARCLKYRESVTLLYSSYVLKHDRDLRNW